MRAAVLLAVSTAMAQTYAVKPASIPQGQVLRVTAPAVSETARLNGRTIRLFPQAGGARLGLMPLPAEERPGRYALEFLSKDGAVLHTEAVTVTDAHFGSQNVVMGRQTAELKPSPGEMDTLSAFRKTVSEVRYWDEPFAAPVAGCMTSPFGVRRLRNGKPTGDYHGGIDQRAAAGAPIRAVAAGVVRMVRTYNVHGGTVAVDHGQGVESIYLHMSRFAVTEGQAVKKGDVLGYAGSTGRSTAPHLHWSLYINAVAVNPAQWVSLRACAPKRAQ